MNNPEVPQEVVINKQPANRKKVSAFNDNLPSRKRSNQLLNVTASNQAQIDTFATGVSNYDNEYDAIADEIRQTINTIKTINLSLEQEIKNTINTEGISTDIKKYLSTSFDKIKQRISDFNENIVKLQSQGPVIDNNIEKIKKSIEYIEGFIITREFVPGTVRSRSKDGYKGVIEDKLTDSLGELNNLLETYEKTKDKCISLIADGTVDFNEKVINFKKNLKLKVIDYFNQKILGLKYDGYSDLNKAFRNTKNDTVKLNTLVNMKNLILQIEKDINDFSEILNKKYKYIKGINVYNIGNNNKINSVKATMNEKFSSIVSELNSSIQNYRNVTKEKIEKLQEDVIKMIESIPPPIQTYNSTAGDELQIEINKKCLSNISTGIQSRIKNILGLIDKKLGIEDVNLPIGTNSSKLALFSNSDALEKSNVNNTLQMRPIQEINQHESLNSGPNVSENLQYDSSNNNDDSSIISINNRDNKPIGSFVVGPSNTTSKTIRGKIIGQSNNGKSYILNSLQNENGNPLNGTNYIRKYSSNSNGSEPSVKVSNGVEPNPLPFKIGSSITWISHGKRMNGNITNISKNGTIKVNVPTGYNSKTKEPAFEPTTINLSKHKNNLQVLSYDGFPRDKL